MIKDVVKSVFRHKNTEYTVSLINVDYNVYHLFIYCKGQLAPRFFNYNVDLNEWDEIFYIRKIYSEMAFCFYVQPDDEHEFKNLIKEKIFTNYLQ